MTTETTAEQKTEKPPVSVAIIVDGGKVLMARRRARRVRSPGSSRAARSRPASPGAGGRPRGRRGDRAEG
jgi:hypothetical protein